MPKEDFNLDSKAKVLAEDLLLINKIKNGDEAAFNAFFKKYQRAVELEIFGIVDNKKDTEDIKQEVFTKLFSKLKDETYDVSSPKNFITTVAKNMALHFLRNKKYRNVTLQPEIGQDELNHNSVGEDTFGISPEDQFILAEELQNAKQIDLEGLIKQLSPEKRDIITMYLDQVPVKQIAEKYDTNFRKINGIVHAIARDLRKLANIKPKN